MIMATAAMCSLIRSYMLSASETENIEQVIIEQRNFKSSENVWIQFSIEEGRGGGKGMDLLSFIFVSGTSTFKSSLRIHRGQSKVGRGEGCIRIL